MCFKCYNWNWFEELEIINEECEKYREKQEFVLKQSIGYSKQSIGSFSLKRDEKLKFVFNQSIDYSKQSIGLA